MIDLRFIWFFLAFILAFIFTRGVLALVKKIHLWKLPKGHQKNIHERPMPLLGGLGIFLSIQTCLFFLLFTTNLLTSGEITILHYVGFFLGGLVLMIGGYFDDRYDWPAKKTILAPILASIIVISFGIEIEKLTNPFGGVLFLYSWQSDILVFLWLLMVMYAMKITDGLDGLETGISAIGVLMILLLASTAAYFQSDVQVFAAICFGALFGFLLWNFPPAKIFLGEGGSTYVAYVVGVLAVISGGKLATALLVLGIPFLDFFWVLLRRYHQKGLWAIFSGDRKHLHHRLFDLGWSQRKVIFFYYALAMFFGSTTLFLQSRQKLFVLGILTLFMIFFAVCLVIKEQKKHEKA